MSTEATLLQAVQSQTLKNYEVCPGFKQYSTIFALSTEDYSKTKQRIYWAATSESFKEYLLQLGYPHLFETDPSKAQFLSVDRRTYPGGAATEAENQKRFTYELETAWENLPIERKREYEDMVRQYKRIEPLKQKQIEHLKRSIDQAAKIIHSSETLQELLQLEFNTESSATQKKHQVIELLKKEDVRIIEKDITHFSKKNRARAEISENGSAEIWVAENDTEIFKEIIHEYASIVCMREIIKRQKIASLKSPSDLLVALARGIALKKNPFTTSARAKQKIHKEFDNGLFIIDVITGSKYLKEDLAFLRTT